MDPSAPPQPNPTPLQHTSRSAAPGIPAHVSPNVPRSYAIPVSPVGVTLCLAGNGAHTSHTLPFHSASLQKEEHSMRKPIRQLNFTTMKAGSPPRVSCVKSTFEVKEGSSKKGKQCNCKNSRCLKLYCECFASGVLCDSCNCVNCFNNVENHALRKEAIEATLDRNPHAFRPKIANSPNLQRENREESGEVPIRGRHNKGCHCKKSGCLKKYCECFQANIPCSDNCKCLDCKNCETSNERRALYHNANIGNTLHPSIPYVGAYNSPSLLSKKRKLQDAVYGGPMPREQASLQQFPHVLQPPMASAAMGTYLARMPGTASNVQAPKVSYSSFLMGVVQEDVVKELCKLLVFVSTEALRKFAESEQIDAAGDGPSASAVKDGTPGAVGIHQQELPVERDVAEKYVLKAEPSNTNSETEGGLKRPMSPGTLSLMCDEQDSLSAAAAAAPSGSSTGGFPQKPTLLAQLHAEQERAILTEFRDCLQHVVSVGNKRAALHSTEAAGVDPPARLLLEQRQHHPCQQPLQPRQPQLNEEAQQQQNYCDHYQLQQRQQQEHQMQQHYRQRPEHKQQIRLGYQEQQQQQLLHRYQQQQQQPHLHHQQEFISNENAHSAMASIQHEIAKATSTSSLPVPNGHPSPSFAVYDAASRAIAPVAAAMETTVPNSMCATSLQ